MKWKGDMEAVFGLLPLLAGLSLGIETYCDARQNGTQCYAALGGTVNLQLVTEVQEQYDYSLYKNNSEILKVKSQKFVLTGPAKDRSSFHLNSGTLKLHGIFRSDGSAYHLNIYKNGKLNTSHGIQMSIEAPVSSPRLSPECQHGKVMVSCSSEGDSVQYSWTLDENPLSDAVLISGSNTTRNVTLRRGVSGRLTCSVKNHISNATVTSISPCSGLGYFNCTITNGTYISAWLFKDDNIECAVTTTAPSTVSSHIKAYIIIGAGSFAAVLSLLAIALGFYCFQMKKKATKAPDNGDDQDVIYSDVHAVPGQRRKEEKKPEMEVEYGQVKISGRPIRTAVPPEDDCVYAKVRVGQRQ